jgi:hypothetical protein
VLLAIASTDDGLASARREALSACTSVENVGSTMASMPHYMAQGVNSLTAKGITNAVTGLESMVGLTVTGVEEIVVFYIGMLTNTYLCLTTFAVTGSLSAVIGAIENAQKDLNGMTSDIGNEISSASSDLQNGINSLVSGINSFLGTSAPKVDFTKQINELKNLTLPDSLFADLQKLNNSLPTFQDVKNATETVIRFPFEELKQLINKEMGNYTFNSTLFPVPQKETLSFCSDNNGINDFFDELVHIEQVAKKVFIAVLVLAAIAVCVPMAYWEIMRYRRLQERANLISNKATDPMDAVYMASRPFTSRIGMKLSERFSTPRKQILVRWTVSYCTSLPALFLLSLALAGLFACLCQYILLKQIEKAVPSLTNQVANFSGMVVAKMQNASNVWANGTNAAILAENAKLNDHLFGWVNTSTTAVNDTLNKFVDETMDVLNKTFGGTPLYTPIKEVFDCLIGLKIQGIESGLTWVHDNAHVNFPTLDQDTLSLKALAANSDSAADGSVLSDPTGSASDAITGAISKVTDTIAKGIRQEAIISTMILVVWLILVLIGLVTTCLRMRGRDKVRGEAGNEYISYPAQAIPVMPTIPRPESAAPPYAPNPDVNPHAPYTLARHAFPRPSEDSIEPEKRSSDAWPITRNLTGREPTTSSYPNEKNGFI